MARTVTTKGRQPADAARDPAGESQGTTLRPVPKSASTATRDLAGGSAAAELIGAGARIVGQA